MTEKATSLIRLRLDSVRAGVCRAEDCGAAIVWYRTHRENRFMPMNAGATPTRVDEHEPTIGYFEASQSHWATCPASPRFHRRRRSGGRRDEPERGRDDLDGRRQAHRRHTP